MKLTSKVKLQPTDAQSDGLKRTLELANAACNYISEVAWDQRVRQVPVAKIVYADVRASFDLTAQVVIRCISVTDACQDRPQNQAYLPTIGEHRLRQPYPVLEARQERNLDLDGGRPTEDAVPLPRQSEELLSGQRGEV